MRVPSLNSVTRPEVQALSQHRIGWAPRPQNGTHGVLYFFANCFLFSFIAIGKMHELSSHSATEQTSSRTD